MEQTHQSIEVRQEEFAAINSISEQYLLSNDEIIHEALLLFINHKLEVTKNKLKVLQEKYKVKTVEEFDNLYKEGTIPEEGTWEDFQDFDHFEYAIDKLNTLLIDLNKKEENNESTRNKENNTI